MHGGVLHMGPHIGKTESACERSQVLDLELDVFRDYTKWFGGPGL